MNLPLYEKARAELPVLGTEGHRGLWFERFFNQYDPTWEVLDQGRGAWIKKVVDIGKCGNEAALKRHALSLVQRLGFLGGEYRGFATDWHFATGLGNPHPVENGFLWHPTLGVPYLPGAAVKGLVRAYVEQWDDSLDGEARKQRLRDWFGTEAKGDVPEQAGELIFFDALPFGPVTLAQDVMTPHYGKWYEQGGEIKRPDQEPEKVPADWHDPVPVPFLVVKSAKFVFGIAPRRKEFQGEVKPALDALQEALGWLGAGAKTAVGYGRMEPVPEVDTWLNDRLREREQEDRRQEEKRALDAALASLSPLAQDLERKIRDKSEKNLETDKNAFNQEVEAWIGRLEADPQRDAIERLAGITRRHYKGLLENPNKTEGKKQKPAFSDWLRKIAHRLNALVQ
jgi:CRISPR-associated protein Cmr6